MSRTRRAVLIAVSLLVVAGVVVFFTLDRIVKREVESHASASLGLRTTLGSARLSLFGGKLDLHQLGIESPRGFSAPRLLELGNVGLAVKYGQLRSDPIHVEAIEIDKPKLVIEQSGGALNFRKAMELMPPHEPSSRPIKLVIDELKIADAEVVIRPGLPGLQQEIVVSVRSLSMRNIGSGHGARNGAAIKDVAVQVMTALAAAAAESEAVPPEVRAVLRLGAGGNPAKVLEDAGALLGGIRAPAGRAPPAKR